MTKPYNDFVSNYYAYVLCSFFFCDTWLLSVSEPYPELQLLHHCKTNMIMLQENTLECLSINAKRLVQINWWFVIGFATIICNGRIWWLGALCSILFPGTFQSSVMMSYLCHYKSKSFVIILITWDSNCIQWNDPEAYYCTLNDSVGLFPCPYFWWTFSHCPVQWLPCYFTSTSAGQKLVEGDAHFFLFI